MQYSYSTADIKRHKECVVVLGNFDGVHKGHQMLFKVARQEAHKKGLETVVFSFYPHPTWVIGNQPKSLLMSRRDKKRMVQHLGMDVLVEYPFTKEFASISPEEFFTKILIEQLKARVLVVGSNYYFGRDKIGNPSFLKGLGKTYNVEVHVIEAVMEKNQMISSSQIRQLILTGKIEKANEMLGHPYMIVGNVVQGKQLGRTIGFPTINLIADPDRVYPPNGVYATKVKVYSKTFLGMTNIGYNPTVNGEKKMIETHILDFNETLYGEEVEVDFYHFIRPEQKFDSIEALQAQISCDKERVLQIFKESVNGIAK
ncbi:MAG: bifunctional riboflavin kinase/FAD synthetase [Cellulosilyticum sp.]|nr:bifunctional riboflavin kinase/FAD synthetase [Cellulosilyticum sp.]MEE1071075.1 bifunctional riboflavin kinase/FAD synthetase [Cellulosilyticum sp.]